MTVSIIIPIYNVEQYIERCINSVINQTYRQLEVILVDDCSPDCSLRIAKQVVEKSEKSRDLNFIYLKHEKNRGLSAARNTGIKAASGDYIYLLDSDDEITPICIESLVSLAQKYKGVNIVHGNTWCNNDRYAWLDISKKRLPEFSNDREWIKKQYVNIDYNLKDYIPVIACNKLYDREWFVNNQLWFKEGIIHEDQHWRIMSWKHIDSTAFSNAITYKYYIREGSIVTSAKTKDKKYRSFLEIYKDYLPTIGNFSNEDIRKILTRLLKIRRDYEHVSDVESFTNHYNDVLKEVIKNSSLNFRIKLALLYISLPPKYVKFRVLYKIL